MYMKSSDNVQVRKLPKKTVYMIVTIVVLGLIAIIATSLSEQLRMKGILKNLGYVNVDNITIYNKTPVQDETTNEDAELTKLRFTDLNSSKECFGFILRIKKTGQYKKDLDCK